MNLALHIPDRVHSGGPAPRPLGARHVPRRHSQAGGGDHRRLEPGRTRWSFVGWPRRAGDVTSRPAGRVVLVREPSSGPRAGTRSHQPFSHGRGGPGELLPEVVEPPG